MKKGFFFSIVIFSLRLPNIITFCEKAKNNEPKLINDGTNLSYFSCIKQVPHRIISYCILCITSNDTYLGSAGMERLFGSQKCHEFPLFLYFALPEKISFGIA